MSNEEAYELNSRAAFEALQAVWKEHRNASYSFCSLFFARWWNDTGSKLRRLEDEDEEEFAKRVTWLAWADGADKTVLNYMEDEWN